MIPKSFSRTLRRIDQLRQKAGLKSSRVRISRLSIDVRISLYTLSKAVSGIFGSLTGIKVKEHCVHDVEAHGPIS